MFKFETDHYSFLYDQKMTDRFFIVFGIQYSTKIKTGIYQYYKYYEDALF